MCYNGVNDATEKKQDCTAKGDKEFKGTLDIL